MRSIGYSRNVDYLYFAASTIEYYFFLFPLYLFHDYNVIYIFPDWKIQNNSRHTLPAAEVIRKTYKQETSGSRQC